MVWTQLGGYGVRSVDESSALGGEGGSEHSTTGAACVESLECGCEVLSTLTQRFKDMILSFLHADSSAYPPPTLSAVLP